MTLEANKVFYLDSPSEDFLQHLRDEAENVGMRLVTYRPPEGPLHCKYMLGKAPKKRGAEPAPVGRPMGERSKEILAMPVGGTYLIKGDNLPSLRVYVSSLNNRSGFRFSGSVVRDDGGIYGLRVTRIS